MLLLYNGLERLLRKVDMLAPRLTGLPIITKSNIEWIWLGVLDELMDVEFKISKKDLGWLYKEYAIVFFIHKDHLYECWVTTLKGYAEEVMKEKKLSPEKKIGFLTKTPDGKIIGCVSVAEVIKLSNKIEKPIEEPVNQEG
jgi:hypothetical protein